MNEPRETQDLDQTLRNWAERRRAAKNFDGLLNRIVAAWSEPSEAERPTEPVDTPRLRRINRSPAAWCAMGATAAALVAAILLLVFRNRPDHDGAPNGLPPQYAWLEESQLGEKAALLPEMAAMFENRLQWIAETDGRVVLQVQQDSDGGATPTGTPDLVVRLVVVRRGPQTTRWTPVWAVDVVARREQVVRLTPANADLPPGTEFSLWAFPVDDDVIAVDSRLSLVEHSLEAEFSDVQCPGVPAMMHEVQTDGQQYRVFQTIAVLDREV